MFTIISSAYYLKEIMHYLSTEEDHGNNRRANVSDEVPLTQTPMNGRSEEHHLSNSASRPHEKALLPPMDYQFSGQHHHGHGHLESQENYVFSSHQNTAPKSILVKGQNNQQYLVSSDDNQNPNDQSEVWLPTNTPNKALQTPVTELTTPQISPDHQAAVQQASPSHIRDVGTVTPAMSHTYNQVAGQTSETIPWMSKPTATTPSHENQSNFNYQVQVPTGGRPMQPLNMNAHETVKQRHYDSLEQSFEQANSVPGLPNQNLNLSHIGIIEIPKDDRIRQPSRNVRGRKAVRSEAQGARTMTSRPGSRNRK